MDERANTDDLLWVARQRPWRAHQTCPTLLRHSPPGKFVLGTPAPRSPTRQPFGDLCGWKVSFEGAFGTGVDVVGGPS